MTLENRVAVITGATGGLGSVVTRELAGRGANLVLLNRDPDKLAALTGSLSLPESRMLARTVDLLDPSETKSAAEAVAAKFGRIDILLHLVGGWTGGKTILEVPADDLTFMLKQHIWTSFNVTQAFVPHLVGNGWGRVVMITSPFAARPNAKGGPYAIGKSGQEALMLTLSQELKGTGVTANLLQARTIDIKREKISAPSPDNASWTTPEELAAGILYLLSDEAGTVNGVKIPLYGSY
ncbi:MAG: SDR family oxidoreductase [Candidatus Atribacteria bacterium]|nr:SDR family oxidoreductase [Candidatus Atribacteria bacterium]